jgi:two-component system response regulator HydG
VTPEARKILLGFDWPGNVRQLRNVVESMVVVDMDELIAPDDLPEEVGGLPPSVAVGLTGGSLDELIGKPLAEIERLFIMETLRSVGGNRKEAARLLDIGERTLYRVLKEDAPK